MAHSFSKRSRERLKMAHPDLIKIMNVAISVSAIDFGISCVARTFEEQLALFYDGKTKLDPRIPSKLAVAKHVINADRLLAEAVDIYIYHSDDDLRKKLAYDKPSLAYVAGVISTVAEILHRHGEIEHTVRWGGNWDRDGVILADQSFDDLPHVELVKI